MPEGYRFPIPGYKKKVDLHHGSDHGGSDLFAPEGTPVVAMVEGVVVDAGSSGPGGNNVTIRGRDGRHYYYAHLREKPHVRTGERVVAGERIGSVGETGNAKGTGAHLHIGIGPEIQSGVGPKGGTGRDFDAVTFLAEVQGTERSGGPKVQARVVAQEETVDTELAEKKRAAEMLRNTIAQLSKPAPKPAATGSVFKPGPEIAEWEAAEEERKANLQIARDDLREAERDINALETRSRPPTAAQQASGARADERLDISSANAGAKDVQRGRELRRAGEYAWGPDGIPYGIYDDDGKLRLLDQKEQTRAITLIRSGAIKRKREVPGTPSYPGQTPEMTVVEETATLPVGLGGTDGPGKLIEIGRSVYREKPDGTLQKVHEEPRDPKEPGFRTVGRSVYRENPDGTLSKVHEEPRDAPQLSARHPEEVARDKQLVEGGALDIEKKKRDLLGPATVALQNHIALIDQVEKMVADGQLKPEQATQYVAASEKNYQAALMGTTVAAQEEAVKSAHRERQKLGTDLLNQRVQSGSSLAASLTAAAFGSGVMMPKGQTSLGYDPMAVALEQVNTLGGGPQVGEFARQLLMESGVPGQPAAPVGAPYLPPQRMMPGGV